MSDLITIDLTVFCASMYSDPRAYLYEPALLDLTEARKTVSAASNGHWMVIIDGSDAKVTPKAAGEQKWPENITNSVNTFIATTKTEKIGSKRCIRLDTLDLPPSKPCHACNGVREIIGDCDHCGRVEDEICIKCDNHGRAEQSIVILEYVFNVEYLRDLSSHLPECYLSLPAHPKETRPACRFDFKGGFGFLMPLKPGRRHRYHHESCQFLKQETAA